MTRHRNRSSC